MVHGNAVFIREEAKQARNTHWYTFSKRNFTSLNFVNFSEHKANYTTGCKKFFAHVIKCDARGHYP